MAMLDEPADRLKRSLDALVGDHKNDRDLLGAKKMIDYVLDSPVLMRNKASRTKFLEQMRDELMQLYDAAFAGATTPPTAPSGTSDAEAKIEAKLIADFVAKHNGRVVQIRDAMTWSRLSSAKTPKKAASGTKTIVFENKIQSSRPTVFFEKNEISPLGHVVRFIAEAKLANNPRTYENNKNNVYIVDDEDGTAAKFRGFSVLRNGQPEGGRNAVFLPDNLPINLEHVDYLTIFPFDAKAYQIVVDAKKKYGETDPTFNYTNDVITRATYQSRTDDTTLTPKPALNYLLGIDNDRPFEDFVFYH